MTENRVLKEDIDNFADNFQFSELIRNKSFLITGGTGLIGSILIKCLLELNRSKKLNLKIAAIARDKEKVKDMFGETDIEWIFQDVTMPLDGIGKIDYIVHLASPTESKFFIEKPVETLVTAFEGTASILEYSREFKPESVVYASSLETYGANFTDNTIREDFQGYINPLDVRSSYSMGKRTAECLCFAYAKEYAVPVKIARLTQTFGAGISERDNRVFAQFSRQILEGKNLVLHTEGLSAKPYCYTTDAVSALFHILLKGKNGEAYNVANPETYVSIREMAEMLCKEFSEGQKVIVERKEDMGYAPTTLLRLDCSRLEALGWKPNYGLRDMFGRLIAYLKEQI